MKPLLILTMTAAIAAACSPNASPAAGDAPQGQQAAPLPAPVAAESAVPTTGTPPAGPAPSPATVESTVQSAPPAAPITAAPAPAPAPVTPAQRPPAAAAAPTAAAAAPPKPVTPPAPQFRDLVIPAGTSLSVTVLSNLGSTTSNVEDPVKGALAAPVVVSGTTALPPNTEITGFVTDVKKSGRVKGKASLAFRFDRMMVRGEAHPLQTARVIMEAGDKRSDDVKKGGLGAGLGAIVGGVAGGGSGAAIGAVAGGTGAILATKGRDVEVPAGTVVNVLVQESLTVRVPIRP
jgi:hypothetical protein